MAQKVSKIYDPDILPLVELTFTPDEQFHWFFPWIRFLAYSLSQGC